MVVGHNVQRQTSSPSVWPVVKRLKEFQYLGSIIADYGRIDAKVDRRIANASKGLWCTQTGSLQLILMTKRLIYQACVLSVFLYGGESWTLLRRHLKRLDSFHHRCIHTVLGITNKQQWEERIPSETLRERWGDVKTITTKL